MNAKRFLNMCLTLGKKHAPTIMTVLGVVGVGVGTYEACKATRKIDEVIEEHNNGVTQIQMSKSVGRDLVNTDNTALYTEKDANKAMTMQYVKTGGKFVKLYAPAGIILGSSVAMFLGSHKIMSGRNAALGAAYATLDTCYKNYKDRVVEKYGADAGKELELGLKKVASKKKDNDEVTYKVVDPKTVGNLNDGYSKFFDEFNCPGVWDKDPKVNKNFLLTNQHYANQRLKAKGVLFLNEVYEILGYEPTKEGQVIGWVYDKSNENKIDFGIYDVRNEAKEDFLQGRENCILLTFNVDGYVLDKIGLRK